MSSDQKVKMDNCSIRSEEAEAPPPAPPMDPEDYIPGFEYELEENIRGSTSSVENSVNSRVVPDFESGRHPHAKLFVVVFAILGNLFIVYQAARDIPREFRPIFCMIFGFTTCTAQDEGKAGMNEIIEFFFHLNLEVLFPLAVIFVFFMTQLTIFVMPGMAFKIRNPVPPIAKFICLTMFLRCLTNILSSISMLPYLGTTAQASFWIEYLIVSSLGLFWMYQILNMNAFSRLTRLNFIRARENFQFRQNAALEF